jgi:hypothetical protein
MDSIGETMGSDRKEALSVVYGLLGGERYGSVGKANDCPKIKIA